MYRSQERAWPPASAHRCQLCDTGVCPRVGQGMAIITQLSVPTPPHSWALSMSKGEAAAVTSKNLPSPQPSRPLKPGDPVPQKVSFEPRARESDVYPATLKLSRGQAPGSEKVQAGRFLSALPLLLMEPEVIQAIEANSVLVLLGQPPANCAKWHHYLASLHLAFPVCAMGRSG